jgi:hypothetical protein
MELNERFKLLTNYNVKNTLTENVVSILNEDAITKAAREGVIVAKELEGVIKLMKADEKIAKELKSLKTGGVQTADDLLVVLTLNKLSADAKGFMNSSILKSGTGNIKMLELAAQDIVKSPAFAQKYYKSWVEEGGRVGLENALKKSGRYSDSAITQIVIQSEKNLTTLEKMSKVKTTTNTGGKITKETETLAKETEALAKESHISKYKEKFKTYYNNGKGKLSEIKKNEWVRKGFLKRKGGLGKPVRWVISKRKALAWAAAAGVAYLIWKAWAKSNDLDVEDKDTGDSGTGGSGTGGSGGGTVYTNCTTFPYKKGCQNSAISEVQDCLGLTPDGKFGPNTEAALVAKGYGKEITQDVYNKVKANCGGSTISTTTTTTLNPADNYTLTDVDAENASSLFK